MYPSVLRTIACDLPYPGATFPTDEEMKCNTFRLAWRPLSVMEKHFPGFFKSPFSQMGELQPSVLTVTSNTDVILNKLEYLLTDRVITKVFKRWLYPIKNE